MRKTTLVVAAMLFLIGLAACAGGSDTDGEATVESTEESPPVQPTETVEAPVDTPIPLSTSYPAPATPTMVGPYPGFTPMPTVDPYPGGLATIFHPMGVQCQDPIMPDLTAAIESLEEAGIAVVAAEEVALNVCTACGCDTSEHFRVQINAEDLAMALLLGWRR